MLMLMLVLVSVLVLMLIYSAGGDVDAITSGGLVLM